jgi:hypothetical protein
MSPTASILTVSGILFGFLFAGFWWGLNRELSFRKRQRHFKFGYLILVVVMGLLGYFGIIVPLRELASADASLAPSYHGIVLALIGIYGYMLTEFGHYSVFQRPKYVTRIERVFFILTAVVIIAFVFYWWIL